jgi:hypothetical protein
LGGSPVFTWVFRGGGPRGVRAEGRMETFWNPLREPAPGLAPSSVPFSGSASSPWQLSHMLALTARRTP